MSIPIIKIKVLQKPQIRGKMDVRFPAKVEVENFLTLTKQNGVYRFGVDYTKLAEVGITDPTTAKIALLDQSNGTYKLVSIADILTSSLDPDLQAIAALSGTGGLYRTADGSWALRSLVAPAAGISISNASGVAGNPTFALANDLAALEALSGTNTIYYRSGTDTWSPVTVGSLLSFSGGTINVGDAELVALAGLTSAADKLPYFTGSGTAALADFTAFARTLLDDANQGAMQTTLGLVPGTNVQAFDSDLAALAANSTNGLWARTGIGTGAARTITQPAAGLTVTNGDGVSGNPTLALANDLAALEALSGTNNIYYRSGVDTWSSVTIGSNLTFTGGTLSATGGGGSSGPAKMLTDNGAVGDGTTDDTTAIQNLITANGSNSWLDGGGKTYKITSKLLLPANNTYFKLTNCRFLLTGDIEFLGQSSGTSTYAHFENLFIDATGHTTFGRKVFDYALMSFAKWKDVWINGVNAKTVCWQGGGTAGSSPYYNQWEGCYAANFFNAIRMDDNATIGMSVNSNYIVNCRFQPGTSNTAIYLGQNSQNCVIIACHLESVGGTGIDMQGEGHWVSGCRFEQLTVGIAVGSANTRSGIGMNYYDGCTSNITWGGTTKSTTALAYDPDNVGNASGPGFIARGSNSANGIGYGVGAGGTVTQATSKSTSATLNKAVGRVTMNNAALAANTTVTFLLLNSFVGSNDSVFVQLMGGYTGQGSYQVWGEGVGGGGGIVICVRNITGGSLSDALVIQFTVLKGSTT